MLNACARDESPFTKIGWRAVAVEVTKVVRAAQDTFEIRWEERILETGAPVEREHTAVPSPLCSTPGAHPR
jgi:type IV secretory pathway TrbF-like protein